jgi:hypothetical protein
MSFTDNSGGSSDGGFNGDLETTLIGELKTNTG